MYMYVYTCYVHVHVQYVLCTLHVMYMYMYTTCYVYVHVHYMLCICTCTCTLHVMCMYMYNTSYVRYMLCTCTCTLHVVYMYMYTTCYVYAHVRVHYMLCTCTCICGYVHYIPVGCLTGKGAFARMWKTENASFNAHPPLFPACLLSAPWAFARAVTVHLYNWMKWTAFLFERLTSAVWTALKTLTSALSHVLVSCLASLDSNQLYNCCCMSQH